MITNERQYRITKRKAERFVQALDEFKEKERERADLPQRLIQAERKGIEAQLTSLFEEIEEYERVKKEGVSNLVVTTIDELPILLIKARIASDMTQRELAEQLHMNVQQIQRYEADRYASVSYRRLCEVAHALGVGPQTKISVQRH